MLAVVKTPRIDLRIKGQLSLHLRALLLAEYGSNLFIDEEKDDLDVDLFKTDFYKKSKKEMTPGTYLRMYRENHTLTQAELGNKIGVSKSFVCDLEHDRRAISKGLAKKLAGIFNISAARFI